MKTIEHIDLLIDNETGCAMSNPEGSQTRKQHEKRVGFLRECRTVLLCLDPDQVEKQVLKVKNRLEKYQEAKRAAQQYTSQAKIKAEKKLVDERFQPDILRRQEEILLFIISNDY